MDDRAHDVRETILERVFPELRYGGDPDIERYFDLRASGRMLDALAVYRSRLKPRYPDDDRRVVLLRLYRTRSPEFPDFLRGLLHERADEIITRLRCNIDALVAPLSGVPMRDTYVVLKAVERVARLLPVDADDARRMAQDFSDYAKLLGHRTSEAARAAYLLGEFYDQALVEEDAPTDFIAASLASEQARRQHEHEEEKKNFFDLARIEFDSTDIKRIEIPAGLGRDEDTVLAYCPKYWLRVDDPAFERIVWLYSRKYGTRHYEVFKAIKTGRRKKYQDDDILTMVSTTIATRYNYTVQGDLYMQAAWRRIKASLYGQATPQPRAPVTAGQDLPAPAPKPALEPKPAPEPRPHPARKPAPSTKPVQSARPPAGLARKRAPALSPATHTPATHTPATQSRSPKPVPAPREAPARPRLVRAPAPSPLSREPVHRDPLPELKATGSISDKIKKLSGRAYDVYKEIFLSRVGGHIRAELLKSRIKTGAAFGDQTNTAENIIYDFMERNYSNSYMSWHSSEHRARIQELGFDLDSLDGIIEACYRKIAK